MIVKVIDGGGPQEEAVEHFPLKSREAEVRGEKIKRFYYTAEAVEEASNLSF